MEYAAAVLFVLFLWWFSTGAVLYLVGLPRRTFGWSMTAATVVLALALAGLVATSDDPSIAGAYCAFTCALLIWAWHEMSFLTGFLTGPRKERCPAGASGWQRFGYAAQTLLYHEMAILATATLLVGLTWGAPNRIGLYTFLVLWVMQLSAKFNVFLGVPNLTEQFLPENLFFLKTYFSNRPMNLLFPVSITISTIVTGLIVQSAASDAASSFEIAGYTLVASLLALAVLEHWLLVLPLPAAALWSWGMKSRQGEAVTPSSVRPLTPKVWIKDETGMLSPSGR